VDVVGFGAIGESFLETVLGCSTWALRNGLRSKCARNQFLGDSNRGAGAYRCGVVHIQVLRFVHQVLPPIPRP